MLRLGLDDRTNPPRGSHRYRALRDHDAPAVHRAPDVPRGGEHVLQVGGTVVAGRRSYRDEDDSGRAHRP